MRITWQAWSSIVFCYFVCQQIDAVCPHAISQRVGQDQGGSLQLTGVCVCITGQLSAANATLEESLPAASLCCLLWASFPHSVCAILGKHLQHSPSLSQ